jgi:pyruvate,water dikinase
MEKEDWPDKQGSEGKEGKDGSTLEGAKSLLQLFGSADHPVISRRPCLPPEDQEKDQRGDGGTFRSKRMVSGGVVRSIRYILYIDPLRYNSIQSLETKKLLGRVVGRINGHPRVVEGKVLMMGPGRWGSNNIDLGVNVGYADIDNASVLVEIAGEEAGQVPEVSYGTHFFQDLVENQIIYLPVYPEDAAAEFNSRFFKDSANVLTDLLPDASEFKDCLHLIDVSASAPGKSVHIVADPQARKAIAYLG